MVIMVKSVLLYFPLMNQKISLSKSAPERFYEFLHKMIWLIGFWVTVHEILPVEISKKAAESA